MQICKICKEKTYLNPPEESSAFEVAVIVSQRKHDSSPDKNTWHNMGQAVSLILHDFQDNEFPWIFYNKALLELLDVAFGWPKVGLSGLPKHARIKAKAFFKAVNQKSRRVQNSQVLDRFSLSRCADFQSERKDMIARSAIWNFSCHSIFCTIKTHSTGWSYDDRVGSKFSLYFRFSSYFHEKSTIANLMIWKYI